MYSIKYYDRQEKAYKKDYCFRKRAIKRLMILINETDRNDEKRYDIIFFFPLDFHFKTFLRCLEKQTIIY